MFSSWEVYFARKLHSRLSRRFKQKQLPNVRDISWKIVNFLFFIILDWDFWGQGFQSSISLTPIQLPPRWTQGSPFCTSVSFLFTCCSSFHSCHTCCSSLSFLSHLLLIPFILGTLVVDPFHSFHKKCWSLSFFSCHS